MFVLIVFLAGFIQEKIVDYIIANHDRKTHSKEFTAMIINDHSASGVYDALKEAGLEVGKDISVIGCDDLSWASHMHPPLTTVRIPRSRLAKRAVEILENLIARNEHVFDSVTMPVQLMIRESTGDV